MHASPWVNKICYNKFMTFLTFLWSLSFLSIAGVAGFIAFRKGKMSSSPNCTPLDLGGFVREEIRHLVEHASKMAALLKPHASKLGLVVFRYGKRGHTAFSERLFGRILSERGKTASFFLKYIAEHKENLRKAIPEQIGY